MKDKLGFKHREKFVPYYNIRIAEGCLFCCSYCCIRFATGRLKSKPIDHILEEFKIGLREGHKIFQLVCEDVGCYGLDIGTTFLGVAVTSAYAYLGIKPGLNRAN